MTSLRSFGPRGRTFPILLAVLGLGLAAGCGGSEKTGNTPVGDGGIPAPVVIDPPMRAFPDTLVGQSSAAKMFTVRNTHSSALMLGRRHGHGGGRRISSWPAAAAACWAATRPALVMVVFKPTRAGDLTATLEISAAAGARPPC